MKCRIIVFFSLFLSLSFSLSAQIETKIIGTWVVDSVSENKNTRLNNYEGKQIDKLKKSTVVFSADHHAHFKLFLSRFNIGDGYWYYNEQKDVIIITKWSNRKHDLMRLWYDELENGNLKFYIDGTPFEIYVHKTED